MGCRKVFGRSLSWLILRYYSEILLEELREATFAVDSSTYS
jgi:hypothetical protein